MTSKKTAAAKALALGGRDPADMHEVCSAP
jgi:hypothetical protein